MAKQRDIKTDPDDIAAQMAVIQAELAELKALMVAAGETRADQAKEHADDGLEQLRFQAQKIAADVEQFTQEKPGLTLAFAAGFGYLIGLLTARR